jgi:predicted alpha/beta hydrolase family esterase
MVVQHQIAGTAAGVPFVAVPPSGDAESVPVVVAWHLMDPPRTETAFAAALPLDGLDAWRIYLGLPMSGSRLPEGGLDELMRLGFEDAPVNLQGPISAQAAAEFGPAFRELRERFGFAEQPAGLLGGSQGAAVALQVMAEGQVAPAAAVLVSPLVQLRPAVEALAGRFGVSYSWTAESDGIARRMDFVARAADIARHGDPAVLLVVGADDDEAGFREPAARLRGALGDRADLVLVPGMGHALADEPGLEPAAQTPAAVEVDRLAAGWLARHLN